MATKRYGVDFDPATTPLAGTETLSIVQGGTTKDATVSDIRGGALINPMTTAEDLIKGGVAGAPTRVPVGTNGQVLTVTAGSVGWATPSSGFTNPMTTLGDLIRGGVGGAAERLGIGTAGQVLTVVGGTAAWAAASAASTTYAPGAATYTELRPVPNSGTWNSNGAGLVTGTGNGSAPVIDTTNRATRLYRIRYTSPTATATSICGIRMTDARFFLGTAATKGFEFRGGWMMAVGTSVATHRVFYGLRNDAAPTDVNPSTLTNILGFGYDAADTTVQFFHNDASGTATKVSTGIAKPATDSSAAFFVRIFAPGGATVNYEITEVVSGATFSGTATTDLPAATQDLRMNHYASVGGTSSTIGCDYFGFGARLDI